MTTTPPAPTVTVYTDADPCPRAEVLVTPMPVDAASVTVWRSWRGQRSVVRGAKATLAAGDFLIEDYEVPLGTEVSYSCVTADVSGIPSEESAATAVTVDVADVWLQDPLDPTTALQVGLTIARPLMAVHPSFTSGFGGQINTPSPVGSSRPLALGGTLQSGARIPMTIEASDVALASQLTDLIRQSWPTLCVRTPAAVFTLDGLTYLALADFEPEPGVGWADVLFPLTGRSVIGPGAGVVVPPRTFDHLLDEAATFDDLTALYATFVDLQRGA